MLPFKNPHISLEEPPARWKIGVDHRRVALYVGLALIGGFAFGFATSRYLVQNPNPAASPKNAPVGSGRSASADPLTEFHRVIAVPRADTIEVDGVGLVRLIGIETPDGKPPSEGYGAYGQSALSYAERILRGQEVRLEFDLANAAGGNKDDTGRTLAYVYTRDGLLVNAELLKQGLAMVHHAEEFRRSADFLALERDAMEAARGVWGPRGGAGTSPPPLVDASPGGVNASSDKSKKLQPLSPAALGPNVPATASPTASTSEQSVFISPSDHLYHKSDCEYLGKKKEAISLSQAKARGYSACSRCFASTVLKAP